MEDRAVRLTEDHEDALLRESQAAALLNVSRRTLQMWRSRGIGPRFFKLGGRSIRYCRGDVLAFAAGGERPPDAVQLWTRQPSSNTPPQAGLLAASARMDRALCAELFGATGGEVRFGFNRDSAAWRNGRCSVYPNVPGPDEFEERRGERNILRAIAHAKEDLDRKLAQQPLRTKRNGDDLAGRVRVTITVEQGDQTVVGDCKASDSADER